MGQEVLQGLIITEWDGFCHPFHILLGGLNQPAGVLSGGLARVACMQLKHWRIIAMEVKQMGSYAPKGLFHGGLLVAA